MKGCRLSVALSSFSLACACGAQSVYPAPLTDVYTRFRAVNLDGSFTYLDPHETTTIGTAPTTRSDGGTYDDVTWSAIGTATTYQEKSYASISMTAPIPGLNRFSQSHAEPNNNDIWLIDSPGLTGTTGTITGTFHVDGDLISECDSGGGYFSSRVRFYQYFNPYLTGNTFVLEQGTWGTLMDVFHPDAAPDGVETTQHIDSNVTWSYNFTFGDPFCVGFNLVTDAYAYEFAGNIAGGHAIADFSHTGQWGGVSSVKDINGNAIADYSGRSLRGRSLQTVPEPASMVAICVGSLLLIRRRKRNF